MKDEKDRRAGVVLVFFHPSSFILHPSRSGIVNARRAADNTVVTRTRGGDGPMNPPDVHQIAERVQHLRPRLDPLYREIEKVLVGQRLLVDRLLVGLLTAGHVLLEGVPGLAKTLAVRTLAQGLRLSFSRIQFTPDLLPADVIGTQIYNPRSGEFSIKKGPIFANIVLADEINRSPAKVQSALLEAMQEKQVTLGDHTYLLQQPFLVLATQNPIEQEGTYPLPEAQVDRFMLKLKVTYPSKDEEFDILNRMAAVEPDIYVQPVLEAKDVLELRAGLDQIYVADKLKRYIVDVIHATRRPAEYGLDLAPYIQYGASPRATIFLTRAAKAMAFLDARGFVTPQDVKTIGYDVLRHRVSVTYEAEAEEITSEKLLQRLFDTLKVP
jgi:MoxR-like ATPase